MRAKRQAPVASEHQEQAAFINWCSAMEFQHKELALIYAVPNGGKRDIVTASKLKREGVKRGVPDISLPVPSNGYHGLYIELKRTRGGKLSEEQKWWKKELEKQGYKVVIGYGWEDAAKKTLDYLKCSQTA